MAICPNLTIDNLGKRNLTQCINIFSLQISSEGGIDSSDSVGKGAHLRRRGKHQDDEDDDLDEAATTSPNKTIVVKVTSNAKGEATVTPTTSTVVALPSGTIVTRADTTVEAVSAAPVTSTRSTLAAQSPSLVTSTKPLLTTSSKCITAIGLSASAAASKTTST